jgi:2-phosphosulfolactate phosphatase
MGREQVVAGSSPQVVGGGQVSCCAHLGVERKHSPTPVGNLESGHGSSLGVTVCHARGAWVGGVGSVARVSNQVEQEQYQVRFEWGAAGARAISIGADVVVLVDVLSDGTGFVDSLDANEAIIVDGSLRNCEAVARWALDRQEGKGDRFTVAVVASGARREDGELRFALEDLLGAGAIIDALASVGIDYCSPEAASAAAAYTGLRNATGHLIGASTGGRATAKNGGRAAIDVAIDLNSSDEVPILREFRLGK